MVSKCSWIEETGCYLFSLSLLFKLNAIIYLLVIDYDIFWSEEFISEKLPRKISGRKLRTNVSLIFFPLTYRCLLFWLYKILKSLKIITDYRFVIPRLSSLQKARELHPLLLFYLVLSVTSFCSSCFSIFLGASRRDDGFLQISSTCGTTWTWDFYIIYYYCYLNLIHCYNLKISFQELEYCSGVLKQAGRQCPSPPQIWRLEIMASDNSG